MFGIPVALEAFKASKEVLVRRPAPPGIRPFLENNRRKKQECHNINLKGARPNAIALASYSPLEWTSPRTKFSKARAI
jgi:hypothetical protein